MSARSGDQMDVPFLPVKKDVRTSLRAAKMAEDGPAAATVLQSESADWSVENYKSKYADRFDVRSSNDMLADGLSAIIYDRRGVKSDTNIGSWNCSWQVM